MKSRILGMIMALTISMNAFSADKSGKDQFVEAMELVREAINELNTVVENSQGRIDSMDAKTKIVQIDSIINASIDNTHSYTIYADAYGPDNDPYVIQAEYDARQTKAMHKFVTSVVSITATFLTIIIIVILCLYYNYKKRTARYRMIEKAIENNYDIPESLVNEQPTMSMPQWSNSIFGGNQSQGGNQDAKISRPAMPKEFYTNPFKWKELKSGLVMASIGVALVLAFGANFMGAVCSVLIFIGVGKMVANYLEVRDMERGFMATQQQEYVNVQPKKAASNKGVDDTPKQEPKAEETVRVEETWRFAPEEIREEVKREEVKENKENNTPEPPAIPEE